MIRVLLYLLISVGVISRVEAQLVDWLYAYAPGINKNVHKPSIINNSPVVDPNMQAGSIALPFPGDPNQGIGQ